MNLYTQIQESVKDYSQLIVEYSKKKFVKEAMLTVAVLVLLLVGKGIYTWHTQRSNAQAFAGLLEISKAYEQALSKAQGQENLPQDQQMNDPWEDVELLLQAISSAHSRSSLAPFFIIYQAELAIAKDGDHDKACMLMNKAVAKLSKKSVYYDMFNLKRIKMLLDSQQTEVVARAVKELQAIADNQKNYYHQEALHILAQYYRANNDMQASLEYLKKLAATKIDDAMIVNPWVSQAQEMLESLPASL